MPALLVFFELVRSWSIVPTVWRSTVVAPLHKGGSADQLTNYRPISLLCSCQQVFEWLGLKRLLPHIEPLLKSQAGFRWGAKEQIYTLAETALFAHSLMYARLSMRPGGTQSF